jgi:UDP-2,3-diacylglucosamine pyrophosphatase LpxH
LVVSDLHLADGNAILDGFGDYQQAAFEGLLRAASPTGPLGQANDVELIINGDCLDFLVTPPYDLHGITDIPVALGKLEKIIAAHSPFFEALRQFLAEPRRHITIITGNHDVELRFEPVRMHILDALGGKEAAKVVMFCPTRFYRPLPDVYIEHGNYYDVWNHVRTGLWDEEGQPLSKAPETITLPVGSHYYQQAAYHMSVKYPYFDHFEPTMNIVRQMALLCLLNPEMVMETAQRVSAMISHPHTPLAHLAPGEEHIPAQLFAAAMIDFATFQQNMLERKTDWTAPVGLDTSQAQANAIVEISTLRETLAQQGSQDTQIIETVAAICTPTTYQMGEEVATGMHNVLKDDQNLRYAIAGHTHMVRIDPMDNGRQTYLNTASWTPRLALPAPGEITPDLVEWLRQPDWNTIPLRDVTQLIFAMITASSENETSDTPATSASSASLCVWEGGVQGRYRVLA